MVFACVECLKVYTIQILGLKYGSIDVQASMPLDYPYYKDLWPESRFKRDFAVLRDYPLKLWDVQKASKALSGFRFEQCEGKHLIILDDHEKTKRLNSLTDYFSEKCRLQCKKYNRAKTPHQLFIEIGESIRRKARSKADYHERLTSHFYEGGHYCQLFRITVIRQLYMHFKAENILDFSAGWGDRLIAACSLGKRYTGVDPSACMKPVYEEIIAKCAADKSKYTMINQPFEELDLKSLESSFDFIFSSPPFFKLETYVDDYQQSTAKYPELQDWKERFLYVLIRKCEAYLRPNGYFCIHIYDYKGVHYVRDMLAYIKSNTSLRYVGKFYYVIRYSGGKTTYQRPKFIRVYKKPPDHADSACERSSTATSSPG
jgi:16S rRNA G966 N2-methylase RsmD